MPTTVTTVPVTGGGIFTRGCGELWYSTVTTSGVPVSPGAHGGPATTGSAGDGTGPASGGSGGSSSGSGGSGSGGGGTGGGSPSGGGGTGTGGGGTGSGAAPTGGGYSAPTGSSGPLPTQPEIGDTPVAGPISRAEVLARARYWASQGVPYAMGGYTNDPQGKIYRTDCSGLVSMALHLNDSLSTVTLPSQCYPIPKEELKPGDIVGNLGGGTAGAAGHVMIFNGWTDDSHTTFRTIEETPPAAVERTRTWGSAAYTSGAWRYGHLLDP